MVEGAVSYPKVFGEFATIRKLLDGFSIARFGDGEFKMADGQGYRREEANPVLARELKTILATPSATCVVGIPTMDLAGAKIHNWLRHVVRFRMMVSDDVKYYSAFISRPDSAQWINTVEYADLFQRVWSGKKVAAICESDNSMLRLLERSARKVDHIECPSYGAFSMIDRFERAARKSRADVVMMSCGPTATCLANRLSRHMQAIDFGSGGGFLLKLVRELSAA
jgi:hypothetical protein